MTRIRKDDVSALAAANRQEEPREYRLSRSMRILLAFYAVALAASLLGLLGLALNAQAEADRRQVAIQQELDRRSVLRDSRERQLRAELEAQEEGTRVTVCALLTSGEIGTGPRVRSLAAQLRCT